MGVLRTPPDDPVADRLAAIADDMRELLAEHPVDVVALERILFQVNVRSAIGVAQATGVIMAEARRSGAEVAEYSPNTVKQTVAGDGAADKSQMERMVKSLLKIDHPIRPVDAADAVGVALCHLAHAPMAGRVRAALASNGPRREHSASVASNGPRRES
jgi:crossover junction endodeoxyribonuclease RuvC